MLPGRNFRPALPGVTGYAKSIRSPGAGKKYNTPIRFNYSIVLGTRTKSLFVLPIGLHIFHAVGRGCTLLPRRVVGNA